jgi:hypothetical protein
MAIVDDIFFTNYALFSLKTILLSSALEFQPCTILHAVPYEVQVVWQSFNSGGELFMAF